LDLESESGAEVEVDMTSLGWSVEKRAKERVWRGSRNRRSVVVFIFVVGFFFRSEQMKTLDTRATQKKEFLWRIFEEKHAKDPAERDILRLCEPVPPLRETVNQGNESTLTCITHKLFSHTFRHVFNGNTSIFI
jgi:hypothetical protein